MTAGPKRAAHPHGVERPTIPDPPPQDGVTEVVRVTRVAPQAPVDDLAPVRGVVLEPRELSVPHSLEPEADRPHGRPQPVERAERFGCLPCPGRLDGERDHERERALEPEHLEQVIHQ